MQNGTISEAESAKRFKIIIVSLIALFVIVIIAISVISVFVRGKKQANVVNEGDRVEEVSKQDMDDMKTSLYYALENAGVKANQVNDSAIRWSTVYKEDLGEGDYRTSFVVDIDSIKQTYIVYTNGSEAYITCPELSISKYPESFCIGNSGDGDDSISIVLGNSMFPYEGSLEGNVSYSLNRDWENHELIVHVFDCKDNKSAIDASLKDVDRIIKEHKGNPEVFKKRVETNNC